MGPEVTVPMALLAGPQPGTDGNWEELCGLSIRRVLAGIRSLVCEIRQSCRRRQPHQAREGPPVDCGSECLGHG